MADATHPTRRCTHCGERKPLREFYTDPRRQTVCRVCSRRQMQTRLAERTAFLNEYKLSRGCADCGWAEHSEALEFDHRPGTVKLFRISELRSRGSIETLLAEIAKCDVVCANCHRIRTATRGDSGRNQFWDLRRGIEAPRPDFYGDPSQLPLFGD